MAYTKANLIDAVRLTLSGGYPSINDRVQNPEIELCLHDAMNAVMRAATLETNYTFDGGSIPDGSIIATYPSIPVIEESAGVYSFPLPAQPMHLPEGAGLWDVRDPAHPDKDFIPLPAGIGRLLSQSVTFSPMVTSGTWERKGSRVYVTADYSLSDVDVDLCVCDFSSAALTDLIPASADQIEDIKRRALQMLGVTVDKPVVDEVRTPEKS